MISESSIDTSKIYFHGSSEARVQKLDAPSYEHPFYVTTDLHYAMAFCTKNMSNTGEYGVKKTFTPSSQNFVYVVTLKPTCKIFDFRDRSSAEFKKLYSIIDKEIVDWIFEDPEFRDISDIYEFVVLLDMTVLKTIGEYKTYEWYHDANFTMKGEQIVKDARIMPESLFEKAQKFAKEYGLQNAYNDLDIHEIMAPILKGLNKLGFQGILTTEHDTNQELTDKLHIIPSIVRTEYAIGIFDKSGMDQIGLVPMRYTWLKKINPSYLQTTDATADQKVRRYIQLYKKIASNKNINESNVDLKRTWYFGNNRSKNLRISKPSWNKPFSLTSSYEYAQDYADYGVYKIDLKNEAELNILDFSNIAETRKLVWPKIVIDKIKAGQNDLNSIAYDMYALAYDPLHPDKLMYIDDSIWWKRAAEYFKMKSQGIMKLRDGNAVWGTQPDHAFVLQMWKDIYDAGFDGFTHYEFGQQVLMLFDIKCIDKISIVPVKQ